VAMDGQSADSIANENAMLRQLAIAIVDVNAIQSQAIRLWQQEISMMLPEDADAPEASGQAAEGT
jgi:hypothetical protein